jgi:tripartite ATP-independent transporter DctP family solute receptor
MSKNFRSVRIIPLSFLIFFLLTATFLSPPSSEGARIIKCGVIAPIDSSSGQAGVKLAELAKEKSKGEIEIQIFASGSIGNEQELLQGMSMGTSDMSIIIGGTYANVLQDFSVIGMAYAFRDVGHMQKVMRGEIGKELAEKVLKTRDIRIIDASWLYGERHLTTSKKPIWTAEDLTGLKIRVVPVPVYKTSWATLGAVPTPIEWGDLFMALKTGMVSGQENPLSTIKAGAIHQVCKYLHLTAHFTANSVLGVSNKLYKSLSQEERKIIQESAFEAGEYIRGWVERTDREYLIWLQEQGMVLIPTDLSTFRRKASRIPRVFEKGKYLKLYNRIQAVK